MKFQDVVVLLPVDDIEDLSLDQEPAAAEALFSAWTVPFHPAILASAGRTVRWQSVEQFVDDQQFGSSLVLLPSLGDEPWPDEWIERATSAGALVLHDFTDRGAAVREVLARLDPVPGQLPPDRLNADLVADLFALGWCLLQVELLGRRHQYVGGIDREALDDRTLRAAEAIVRGDDEAARDALQVAFDLLAEGREYVYSLETHLVDLTLVAPTTGGKALVEELAGGIPKTLLISGRTVAALATAEPATLAALKTVLTEHGADLVGGEFGEPALALATPEAILAGIRRGLATYDEHLGTRPVVFGRRRFGLTPMLPQILAGCGFVGACHFTLDGGRFPVGNQSKIRWRGTGRASLDALARVPIDGSRADGFLQLPEQLAGAADLDETPTVVFAHWPGQSSPWYDALRRTSRYGAVLGRFLGIGAYFEETTGVGPSVRHEPDVYRSPHLAESVDRGESDPISRWVRYHVRQATVDAIGTLRCMADTTGGAAPRPEETEVLRLAVDDLVEDLSLASPPAEQRLDERLRAALAEAIGRLAASLTRDVGAATTGRLFVNPWSFARTVGWALPTKKRQSDGSDSVVGSAHPAEDPQALATSVNVPAMGFCWVDPDAVAAEDDSSESARPWTFLRRKSRRRPPLAEENVLRNEFFEATIDPATGALRALDDYRTRGNRIAARLALRSKELAVGQRPEDEEAAYSIMVAERIEVETASRDEGRITSHGRLVDRQGNRLAGFRQTMGVRRGSRVLQLDVELMPERQPDRDPWQSYYAVRFAWDDPAAEPRRSVNLMNWPTEVTRFEAPHFVEIHGDRRRTTILTGGLPYHRRVGTRKLDCLLVVRGETARRFRVGIGIDLPHPAAAAIDFLTPEAMDIESAPPNATPSGWLFHVDTPGVIATGWEPLFADGQLAGVRVRLLETEGRATPLRLRSFRRPSAARQTDFLGNTQQELKIEDDHVVVDLEPYEWKQVDVEWE